MVEFRLPLKDRVVKGERIDFSKGAAKTLTLFVYRFNPELPHNPRLDEICIDRKKAGSMVLDTLMYIKGYVVPDLAFRRSCREGVCGSCAMNIDGQNKLACIEPLKDRKSLTIYPLPHQPVLKDLVPDLTHAYAQYASLEPWMKAEPMKEEALQEEENNKDLNVEKREQRQMPEQRALLDGLWECVLCFCCSTSCPSYWWNGDQYLGPATLLQAARWVEDSRDTHEAERMQRLEGPFSLYRCHTILNCTQACPKGLNPASAIQKLKNKCVAESLKPVKTS